MADPQQFDNHLRDALEPTYALERELVGGGMSRVFLATERSLNRRVVIKVLPPELAAGVNRDRFRREIQLAAQLQHPHIVPLYSAGEHGDLLYYTMPFIEGESLRDALHSGMPVRFSVREVVHVLHDVVDALAYAHARGVIHRDIKPGNVLRSGSHAVVTDFGVAKAISVSMPLSGVTASGMAVGTPAYMAPEQLAGDPAADHRMDIYAVGLLAYELLTGVAPFSSPSPQQTLAAQLTRDPAPIDKVRSDVPPALSALIMRCLAKMPEARPQTAAALLAELDRIAPDSGDFPATRMTSNTFAAAAVLLAIMLVAGAFALTHRRGADGARPVTMTAATPAPVVASAPALAPTPLPLLTRAESLAIATAIDRKMQQSAATSVTTSPRAVGMTQEQMTRMTDSLRSAIQGAVIDSFVKMQKAAPAPIIPERLLRNRNPDARAFVPSLDELNHMTVGMSPHDIQATRDGFAERASNPGPPRRVFVSIPMSMRGNPEVGAAAVAMMDSLRRRLAQSRRFVVVDRDSVRIALSQSRTTDSLSKMLKVDVFASLFPSMGRDSTVRWTLMLRDLGASPQFANRSMVASTSRDSLLAPLDSLVRGATRFLYEMDRAPRRTGDGPTSRVQAAPSSPTAPGTPVKP